MEGEGLFSLSRCHLTERQERASWMKKDYYNVTSVLRRQPMTILEYFNASKSYFKNIITNNQYHKNRLYKLDILGLGYFNEIILDLQTGLLTLCRL